MKKLFLALSFIAFGAMSQAQITMPQPSPLSTITQKVGLTDISITYSRPGAKGRKIFGDVVPFDAMWRTGANRSTKISFSDTVKINNVKVPKGDYSIFTVPGEREWMIIINKGVDLSGTNGYKDSEDITRFKVASVPNPFTETFTINFADLAFGSAMVELTWETVKVAFKIESDYDSKVMKSIQSSMVVSPGNYFQAARYYYDTDRDMKQALEWINKSIDSGNNKYWVLHTKALIQAKGGDYKGAIATAESSLAMAKAEGDGAYVKMNESSIAEWKKK